MAHHRPWGSATETKDQIISQLYYFFRRHLENQPETHDLYITLTEPHERLQHLQYRAEAIVEKRVVETPWLPTVLCISARPGDSPRQALDNLLDTVCELMRWDGETGPGDSFFLPDTKGTWTVARRGEQPVRIAALPGPAGEYMMAESNVVAHQSDGGAQSQARSESLSSIAFTPSPGSSASGVSDAKDQLRTRTASLRDRLRQRTSAYWARARGKSDGTTGGGKGVLEESATDGSGELDKGSDTPDQAKAD